MDKELLRSVIIATGLLIIVGIMLWSYIKNQKALKELDEDHQVEDEPAKPKFNLSDYVDLNLNFLKSIKPNSTPETSENNFAPVTEPKIETVVTALEEEDLEPSPRMETPSLIQFSLAANSEHGFNGLDLHSAFSIVGLVYGSLKIYERLDANRLVDYGVACMMEPGTFPDTDLENFYCPGLVFFMQPGVLDNAQEIFDDFVETLQILAIELDGTILDHKKQILSDATIQAIRLSL